MPRFHFDFRHGDDLSPDTTGVLLGSVEEAYLEAVKGAHGIWGELLKERRDPRRCAFEVRTNEGLELFVLPLTELLDSCVDRTPEPGAPPWRKDLRPENLRAASARNLQERSSAPARYWKMPTVCGAGRMDLNPMAGSGNRPIRPRSPE